MYDSVELLQAKKLHLSWGIEPPVGLLLPVSHTAKFWRKSNAGQQTFCALTETAAATNINKVEINFFIVVSFCLTVLVDAVIKNDCLFTGLTILISKLVFNANLSRAFA